MKTVPTRLLWLLYMLLLLTAESCRSKFSRSEQPGYTAEGLLGTQDTIITKAALTARLIGSYAQLSGFTDARYIAGNGQWSIAPDNWVYGDVCADDSHKGSDANDQMLINELAFARALPTNDYLKDVWNARYSGVRLCNDILRGIRFANGVTQDDTTQFAAEARFLRGYFYFDLKKIFGKPSYLDENLPDAGDTITVTNDKDIWPFIEADFAYAYAKLPETQVSAGRVNKWAAAAYLAKAYLYQHKFAQALSLFHTIIVQGKNAQGLKYSLLPNFADNFNPAKNHVNDPELVFAVEYRVNDASSGAHGNNGDIMNFPYGTGPISCCGFNVPSFSLVNAYKVNPLNGLPLIGSHITNDTYNAADLKNDMGINSAGNYTADKTTPVDPRLDWTAGRRGIPYLDWGVNPGLNWVRTQSYDGPYLPIKYSVSKNQIGVYTDNSAWTSGVTANNTMLMRYADVLLMTAEAEVEAGSLDNAQQLVNRVRSRMADPVTWVSNSPALYMIGTYPAGYFTTQGAAYARRAVQFERRLELAQEGHRFFDMVRYGSVTVDMSNYYAHEAKSGMPGYADARFTGGKNEVFPIPQVAIDLASKKGIVLVQNPGY